MPDSQSLARVNVAPRICLKGTQSTCAEAAGLGFTHVLASESEADIPALVGAAVRAGVRPLLDVTLDRVAIGSAMLREAAGIYEPPGKDAGMDPRAAVDLTVASARMDDAAAVRRLAAFWGERLRTWRGRGVDGFRLNGLASAPPEQVADIVSTLRAAAGDGLLLAWTPGMSPAAIRALGGLSLDGVFASLPWWDWQAAWLWPELALLRDVAPVIGAAAAPGGPALDGDAGSRRALLMAAILGHGWAAPTNGADGALLRALNAAVAADDALAGGVSLPAGSGGPILAVLRTDRPDARSASRATLLLVNTSATQARTLDPALILPALGGRFGALRPLLGEGAPLTADRMLAFGPAEAVVFTGEAAARSRRSRTADAAGAREAAGQARRLAIESVTPAVDGGAFPVKRTAGETVTVAADVVFDGHEKIAVALRWQAPGETAWLEVAMRTLGNDRWQAAFPLAGIGLHRYVVTAWRDLFSTFRDELAKKHAAGVDTTLELREGEALIRAAAARSRGDLRAGLGAVVETLAGGDSASRLAALLAEATAQLMQAADDRPFAVESASLPVDAERIGARFASWYEVFPRSLSDDEARHGSFADVTHHLPRIRDMGFDVLYFPPIHPIGRINRKGRNNTLTPAPDDPGSPYAIGGAEGGHDALHPELGTLADFQALLLAAAAHGLELAIDFAIQCAPDHPWLKAHPGWFDWRPDGSIRYAENPPKKYEDIVNVDFYTGDAVPALWLELCRIVLFWADQGVRLFRVDNPHTKPLPFWEWMIAEVRQQYPDAVFLAEAFTRPKIMYRLAKIGFSQSYTYFTWRNTKRELTAYFEELAGQAPQDFFRPHLFVNTPDINPVFLQSSGRPGFVIRAALAATLSGLWGVYNGFELCEADAVPGREEYADSEKYQLRAWDWQRPDNIVAEVTALNRVRRENPALQTHLGVSFLPAANDAVLFYEKATADRSNVVLVAVSLDPVLPQEADVELPLWKWQLPDDARLQVDDLLTGARFIWYGKYQRLRLTPDQPHAIWRAQPAL